MIPIIISGFKYKKKDENTLFAIIQSITGYKYDHEQSVILRYNITSNRLFIDDNDYRESRFLSHGVGDLDSTFNVIIQDPYLKTSNYSSIINHITGWINFHSQQQIERRVIEISNFISHIKTSGIECVIPDIEYIILENKTSGKKSNDNKYLVHIIVKINKTYIIVSNIPVFVFTTKSFIYKTLPFILNKTIKKIKTIDAYIEDRFKGYDTFNLLLSGYKGSNEGNNDAVFVDTIYLQITTPLYLLLNRNEIVTKRKMQAHVSLYHYQKGIIADGVINLLNNKTDESYSIISKYWFSLEGINHEDKIYNISLHPIINEHGYSKYVPIFYVMVHEPKNKIVLGVEKDLYSIHYTKNIKFIYKHHNIETLEDSYYIKPNNIFYKPIDIKPIW